MAEYQLKTGKIGKKAVAAYQKIEDTVVSGYKKIETSFVDAFLEEKPAKKENEPDKEGAS